MNKRFYLLTPLLFFLFCSVCIGQIETKLLSPKKMKKHLTTLLFHLDAHPDPFTKISEEDFLALVEEVKQDISVELDQIDFYKNLAKIIAVLRDGHTRVHMPRYWFTEVRKENGVFPYEVHLTNSGKLHVIKSYGDDKLPLGCRILEINGMKIDDFVDTITPYLSYETIPFRNDQISVSFEFLLYLVFKRSDKLKFKFQAAIESEAVVFNMPFRDWKDQKKEIREIREKKVARGEPYDFSILEPGIAKIDIFSFKVSDFDSYNLFLLKTFKTIKKEGIHSLIIDVRGNYGGWPKVASELFHYIYDGYFKTMAQSSMKISYPYRRYFIDRNPNLMNPNLFFRQRRHYIDLEEVLYGKLDTYVNEEVFFNEPPITERFEFTGNCYLLIDRKSYSASSAFASTFQCYAMGKIIGEPTGGTKIFRANAYFKKLSTNGFGVNMSTTKLYTTCFDGENQPVLPNVEVVPTILDRVHNIDPQLIMALELIRRVQKEKVNGNKIENKRP